jgi:tripartite-type tricarboxylate transporter receptor subunit TctC
MKKSLLTAIAGLAIAAAAQAQDYPLKPVRVIVPSPGGTVDVVARIFVARLTDKWGQSVFIENRAGAGGNIGAEAVFKAPPDGYTLLAISNTFAISPSVIREPGYDPGKDFIGIGMMNSVSLMAVTSSTLPYRTLPELIAAARKAPGALPFASGGTGTTTHLAAAMFLNQAGLSMVHVPYKGNGPAMPDVLSGRVHVIFDPVNTSAAYITDGRFRALGYTAPRRTQQFPNVPTIVEQGFPGYEFAIYTGLVAPAGTPSEVLSRLHSAMGRIKASTELRERFAREGTELATDQPIAQFNDFLRREVERYTTVVKAANIPLE